LQLAEKKKAKKQYHLMEKQFRSTFEKAKNQTGNTSENLIKLLEIRLDNVIYRLGLADSHSQARQLVSHRHFMVNDRTVNIPSFVVKAGDVIKVREKSKKFKHFKEISERQKKQSLPSWLNFNATELSGKVLGQPKMEEVGSNINIQMIVEFYSR
jgi:small subunit ribosomal protein S4